MTPRQALWALVACTALLRLAWAVCLGPGNDEAYHYLYTVHRDWSYYDHPPMVGLVGSFGLLLSGDEVTATALRFGFIVLFAGSTLLMARITRRFFGDWAGVLAAVVLNATAYYGLAAGTFALPDGPLVFFWLATLDRLAVALERPERLRAWLWVGLAWGGALLSKYHGVFLPVGLAAYLLLDPPARACLRRPGPYLALGIGLLAFAPVVLWNAANGWASFAFQAGRATGSLVPRADYLAAFLAGQALYLLPWIWLFLIAVLWRRRRLVFDSFRDGLRRRRAITDSDSGPVPIHAERFLIAFALPPLVMFLVVASLRPILPHWSLVGFLSVIPILGKEWADWGRSDPRRVCRRAVVVLGFILVGASIFVVQARWGPLQKEGPWALGVLDVPRDPTIDMYGWDRVADELRQRGLVDEPGTFLFTSKWYHSGQLAFALGAEAPVLCYRAGGAHGFAHWSEPERWVGRDGILVVVNHSSTEPQVYDRWFERIEPIGAFDVRRSGGVVRKVWLYRCVRQTMPFPYDGRAEEDEPETGEPETVADRGHGVLDRSVQ